LLLLLACTSPAPQDSFAPVPASVSDVGLTENGGDTPGESAIASVSPVSCGETIYVPQSGYVTDEPVVADAHSDVYGKAADPTEVHLGVPGDPSRSVTFLWRTDVDTLASQVQIGTDEVLGNVVDGSSFVYTADTYGRVHEVRVCGLTPGTTWHYRVGGTKGWSDVHTFTTAPTPGEPRPFRFGVAGDSRGAPSDWETIVAAMADQGAEFRLFTGDAVASGSSITQWEDWYDAGGSTIAETMTWQVNGNHEALTQAWFSMVGQPNNEEWFSFDYANVHFVALNDTVGASTDWETQSEWLAADLAATKQTWKVVFHHKAAYSGCRPNGEDTNVRTWFVPVEEAGGVQLDFAGHNHNYERSVPLYDGAEVAQTDGTTFIVTAGSGAPLYNNTKEWSYIATWVQSEHYMLVDVDGDTMTLTAIDLAGNVLDRFTLSP
jgi:hypothetical protein